MKRGFTLIELLVVIATISLLSSIVFASLNSARDKSKDAAMKANLSGMRVAAALIYDNAGTFDTVCNSGTNSGEQFRAAFAISNKATNENLCLNSDITGFRSDSGSLVSAVKAAATPDKWAASMRLKNGNYFCVNYTGIAREQVSRGIDWSPADADC